MKSLIQRRRTGRAVRRLTVADKKDAAVTVLPLTNAVLVLLVLALIVLAPMLFAAMSLS